MQFTTNYDLNKPDLTDKFEVEHQNQNMDIIDGEMKSLDDAISFLATNLITNGNFANGTTGWIAGNSNISASNSICMVVGNGSTSEPHVATASIFKDPTHKYYISAKCKVTNSLCLKINVGYWSAPNYIMLSNPLIDTWYNITGIKTGYTANASLLIMHTYQDATTANGKVMQVKEVETIDLTATFGAGKEPTQAQCDLMFSIWKDATFQISTIESLENNKANRVQEAWITPTLLNSWTEQNPSIAPIRYYKDELGIVRLRGRISGGASGSTIFTLPTGYRPIAQYTCPLLDANSLIKIGSVATNGIFTIYYSAIGTYISLDGLSFRAEQ